MVNQHPSLLILITFIIITIYYFTKFTFNFDNIIILLFMLSACGVINIWIFKFFCFLHYRKKLKKDLELFNKCFDWYKNKYILNYPHTKAEIFMFTFAMLLAVVKFIILIYFKP